MIVNQKEPDHHRRCWVVLCEGQHFGKLRVVLKEYEWSGGAWRRTETRPVTPKSLYQAMAKADWMGKLPHLGHRRYAMTVENFDRVVALLRAGKSQRQIVKETGLGVGTVRALIAGTNRDQS